MDDLSDCNLWDEQRKVAGTKGREREEHIVVQHSDACYALAYMSEYKSISIPQGGAIAREVKLPNS
jgi:hypothetical protein